MSKLYPYLFKSLLLAAAATALYFLSRHLGPVVAFALFAAFITLAGTLSALFLKSAPIGTLTWRNRPAGFFLSFAGRKGRWN